MDIEQISVLARKEGVSYGQYVLTHTAELSSKKAKIVKLRQGERRCACCGRVFFPVNSRNRFCRDACRILWNSSKNRRMKEEENDVQQCKRAV